MTSEVAVDANKKTGNERPGPIKNLIAGGVGGACIVVFGHPFDTIKVRLQTQPKVLPGQEPLFRGTIDCARKTVRSEGPRALYKGMLSPLLGVSPIFSIYFFAYGVGQSIQKNHPSQVLSLQQHALAGGFSAIFGSLVMGPTERVKCLMQVQMHSGGPTKYANSIDCARKVFKEGGFRSLFKGTFATLLRDVPGSAMYFAGYEGVLRYLTPPGQTRDQLSVWSIMAAGSVAGLFNYTIAIAPDTLKSRFQTAPDGRYRGIYHVFTELMSTEGPRALFRGFTPMLLRGVPGNAVCFLGYELTIRLLNKIW